MKGLGAPIYFNHAKNSYCYEKDVVFSIGFRLRNDAAQRAKGGKPYFFMPLHHLCSETLYL